MQVANGGVHERCRCGGPEVLSRAEMILQVIGQVKSCRGAKAAVLR